MTDDDLRDFTSENLPMKNAMNKVSQYFDRKVQSAGEQPTHTTFRWFAAAPRFRLYDEEVMTLFAKISQHHLAETFPILQEPITIGKSRMELVFAAAAVGGLFCMVPGRFRIVRAFYNDSRRMVLDPVYQHKFQNTPDGKLEVARTLIYLAIYGLCSGDQRSYEFTEAFYGDTLSAIKDYVHLAANVGVRRKRSTNDQMHALLQSLYTLECYRVLIMHRPPAGGFNDIRGLQQLLEQSGDTSFSLSSFFDPASEPSRTTKSEKASLSAIIALAWPVLARDVKQTESPSLWRADFFELALNNWAKSQDRSPPWRTTILYNMMIMSIHANLGLILRLAHAPKGVRNRTESSTAFATLKRWRETRHFVIARWHAQALLQRVRLGMKEEGEAGAALGRPSPIVEPPHLPYCVYYASLVLWTSSLLSPDGTKDEELPKSTCVQILAGMKVRVAELLAGILRDLKP